MTSSGDFPGPTASEPGGVPDGTEQTFPEVPSIEAAPVPAPESPADTSAAPIDLGSTSQLGTPWSSGISTETINQTGAAASEAVSEPSLNPELAAIVEIPAQAGASEEASGEGGEWDLLVGQIRDWMATVQLKQSLQEARRPLILLGLLLAVVVVLRVYAAVLGTLDHLPLVPGLLELVGVIVVIRFSLTHLVRSQQRQALVQTIVGRWKAFKG